MTMTVICPICKAPTERRPGWCGNCGSLSEANPILVPASLRENERLRETLSQALDLCRSLLRFGPGGAAGEGMLESLLKLSKEARDL